MGLWDFIDTYRVSTCAILCIIALLFIVIGHCYRDQIQLVLKQEFVKFPESSIDYWSASHFFLFALFGFIVPEYPLSFFALGVAFELTEDYLSSDETTYLADCKEPYYETIEIDPKTSKLHKRRQRRFFCNGYQDGYWYANMTDPWVNLTGYVIGSAIRTTWVNQ